MFNARRVKAVLKKEVMKCKKKRSQRPGDLCRKEGVYKKRRLDIVKAIFVP